MIPPDINQTDFSEFHPLDHSLWQCRAYPGGWRRHLQYRWQWQWSITVHRHTLCRVGHHLSSIWWKDGEPQPPRCFYCGSKEL